MRHEDVRLYEIAEPADVADHRLTTAAKVNAALGNEATADKDLLESIIDQVSGECARYCKLALPPTGVAIRGFGQEEISVTWLGSNCQRGHHIYLPWRVPLVSIESVTEGETELTQGTDFVVLGAGMLLRLSGDQPACWSGARIVVDCTVGWELPDGVPAELEGRVIEQVKMKYLGRDSDPGIRSESSPEVAAIAYNFDGGDSISENGLLRSLESALSAFKNWTVG